LLRSCALRMRVSRSPSGSFIGIVADPPSPARLQQAGNEALGAEIAQRDARKLMLAVVAARPAGDGAAVAHAIDRRIARQLGELERRGETILDRFRLVPRDRLEPRAAAGIFLGHPLPPIVLLDRTLLRHQALLACPRLRDVALTAGTEN